MAGESLLVCTERSDAPLYEKISSAMEPFGGEGTGEWATWWIGESGSEFIVKSGSEGDPRLLREFTNARGELRDIPPHLCDGGPVGLLDLAAHRLRAAERARERWTMWQGLVRQFPAARTLREFMDKDPEATEIRPGKAWVRYRSQPLMTYVLARPELHQKVGDDAVATFGIGLDAYMARCSRRAFAVDSLLTVGGEWVDVGSLSTADEYYDFFSKSVETLEPDNGIAFLTYRC
ncbi:hypothetical protein ACIREE_21845 [Streptomyces sp. NPDC102467]|uniref:hypothetical protein n=1 Tax=Streptomyces sp. NPDC102467 TaxID=3366179 RepID=UPI0037F8B790